MNWEPDPERNKHWPKIDLHRGVRFGEERGRGQNIGRHLRAFFELGPAPHSVLLRNERVTNWDAVRAWLIERFGKPMLVPDTAANYYWTDGVWVGVQEPWPTGRTGRTYYFVHADHAFEFKMRWC